ncbi:MAG: LEA type 2 family protein [Methanoregula sp.]|jgi:LEA14-like dessication related protein|nr:LEA type 2 family protein [Methanoregula sp.]
MKQLILPGIFIIFAIFILSAGCTEPPVKDPTVSVSDIGLSDVTLQTMTVNATVIIFNPNPFGVKLNKVAFDVYFLDDIPTYLGHGEQTNIDVISSGNTTVTVPVTIGNIPAIKAVSTLVRKGSITINVNGSAFIDIKVASFEKPFEQSRQFKASDFESLVPVTSVNITEKVQQLGGLLDIVAG